MKAGIHLFQINLCGHIAGSNVVNLGRLQHQRCIAHILATVARHITEPYANEILPPKAKEVSDLLKDLHSLVGDLRCVF
jgi:hypothetical protein